MQLNVALAELARASIGNVVIEGESAMAKMLAEEQAIAVMTPEELEGRNLQLAARTGAYCVLHGILPEKCGVTLGWDGRWHFVQ